MRFDCVDCSEDVCILRVYACSIVCIIKNLLCPAIDWEHPIWPQYTKIDIVAWSELQCFSGRVSFRSVLVTFCVGPGADVGNQLETWVCLKIVYPYTQWFCWSLSLWKMAISLGIYPTFSDIPTCWAKSPASAALEDVFWSYLVKGTHPKYTAPVVEKAKVATRRQKKGQENFLKLLPFWVNICHVWIYRYDKLWLLYITR